MNKQPRVLKWRTLKKLQVNVKPMHTKQQRALKTITKNLNLKASNTSCGLVKRCSPHSHICCMLHLCLWQVHDNIIMTCEHKRCEIWTLSTQRSIEGFWCRFLMCLQCLQLQDKIWQKIGVFPLCWTCCDCIEMMITSPNWKLLFECVLIQPLEVHHVTHSSSSCHHVFFCPVFATFTPPQVGTFSDCCVFVHCIMLWCCWFTETTLLTWFEWLWKKTHANKLALRWTQIFHGTRETSFCFRAKNVNFTTSQWRIVLRMFL